METPLGFEVNTDVAMVLQLYGVKVRANGIVRAVKPAGMGIQFREVHVQDARKFVAVLNRLADPNQTATYVSVDGTGESVLHRIRDWFKDHDRLSANDFMQLLASPETVE